VASLSLLAIDMFYISWMCSLSHRVPPYVSAGVGQAVFGLMGHMYDALGDTLQRQRTAREESLRRQGQELQFADLES